MFNRYAKVSADGVYTAAPKKLSKFKYISMMVARVSIVDIAYSTLAQAVTVAVRFSAVRRQGFKDTTADTSGGTSIQSEHVVLDYQMQQYVKDSLYIQCSEIFTLRNEKSHTEA
jgi:acyl-CoA oxidase